MSPSSYDQSRTPALYPPDTLIAGRYRIERLLGRGTSGTVYKARDVQVGTAVALKLIHGSVKKNSSAAQRVHQEMRVAHNVRSDYIVNLYTSFVTDTHVGLVLEYVNGTSLFDLHQSGNVLTIHEITNIGRQVAIGLQVIHDAGIVHRDLKLENIMLDEHGIARITDFGVSILASSIEPPSKENSEEPSRPEGRKRRATEAGKVVGTIHYLSPEYLETQRCDHRADLYALGIVLYELVTGQFPYQHKNMRDLVEKKVRYDTPKANVLRPDCPEWLVRLIAKATARKPEDRYQSAKEMHEELAVALHKPLVDLKAQETRRSTVFLRSEKAAPRRSLQSGLYMIIGLLLMFGAFRIIESLYSQGNPFLGHIMNLLQ